METIELQNRALKTKCFHQNEKCDGKYFYNMLNFVVDLDIIFKLPFVNYSHKSSLICATKPRSSDIVLSS